MTIEKFYETLLAVIELDADLRLQPSMEAVRDNLNNVASAPAQPQHQSNLASALTTLAAAAEGLGEALTPALSSAIDVIGGTEFFDSSIYEKVRSHIAANAITPTVARDYVQSLTSRRANFLATVQQSRASLEELGVSSTKLGAGSADLSFVIPRAIFENHLASFAKELAFISRLMGHFSEAVTGQSQPVELEGLSSSIPTIALIAGAKVIEAVGIAVNKFLEAWERIEKIRRMRTELKDMGLKGVALDELTDNITTTITEVVEESTRITLANYQGDQGRKNELETALKQETRRLFGQIERGLTIQFRAEPSEKADNSEHSALKSVQQFGHDIIFPQITNEPILLSSGEVLDGEIKTVVFTRKTTTNKTTVKKVGKNPS